MSCRDTNTPLGKTVAYPRAYAPFLLVALPRRDNRDRYDLHSNTLPFVGTDIWHAWEVGFLTDDGHPVCGVLKIVYSSASDCMVESKSLKLYFNSFNMEKLGPTLLEATDTFVHRVEQDLSRLLNTPVTVRFFNAPSSGHLESTISSFTEIDPLLYESRIPIRHYSETPQLLTPHTTAAPSRRTRMVSHLLRSKCKVTHQPDWGSVFVDIEGSHLPTEESLLAYLVSFRDETHFHEEVCEIIYKRLWDRFSPSALGVTCIFCRRGGIDICPSRVSDPRLFFPDLVSPDVLTPKLHRQ